MKIKRIITLFLVFVLLSGFCLTSCKKDGEEADTSAQTEAMSVESDPNEGKILIADKGTVNYSVVYSEQASDDTRALVKNIVAALQKRSGSKNVKASYANTKSYNADTYEILVGEVDYAESKQVYDSIGYGDWAVSVCGNKLVLAGYSKYSLSKATTELIQAIKNGSDDEGTIALAADYNVIKTEVEVLNSLPKVESAVVPVALDEGQNTGILVVSDMTLEKHNSYLETLKGDGYTLYTSNQICENYFDTYDNGKHVIHAAFYPDEKSSRITIEKKTSLVPLESENVYTPNPDLVTSLAQIGLGEDESGGMAYCYQLADGSFIVIDGGYDGDAENIYNYMKAKAPNGDVVIAAWIVTHNDPDHVEGFKYFMRVYANKFRLEMFIANFPSFSTYSEMGGESGGELTLSVLADRTDCKIIKAHTGQKFYIRNAVVELLYTVDNLLPESDVNGNVLSMIFTIDVEGERAMFLGDATDKAMAITVPKYKEYLKSDIMQLSHHGKRNYSGMKMANTELFYTYVRPEVILWPTSNDNYLAEGDYTEVVSKHPWNLVALQSARECYIAGDCITVLELPYSIYSAYKFDPNEQRSPVCADKPSTTDSLKYLYEVSDKAINNVDW